MRVHASIAAGSSIVIGMKIGDAVGPFCTPRSVSTLAKRSG